MLFLSQVHCHEAPSRIGFTVLWERMQSESFQKCHNLSAVTISWTWHLRPMGLILKIEISINEKKRKQNSCPAKSFPESLPRSLSLSKLSTTFLTKSLGKLYCTSTVQRINKRDPIPEVKDLQKSPPPCHSINSRESAAGEGAYASCGAGQGCGRGKKTGLSALPRCFANATLHRSAPTWLKNYELWIQMIWTTWELVGTRCFALVQTLFNLLEEGLMGSCDKVPLRWNWNMNWMNWMVYAFQAAVYLRSQAVSGLPPTISYYPAGSILVPATIISSLSVLLYYHPTGPRLASRPSCHWFSTQ